MNEGRPGGRSLPLYLTTAFRCFIPGGKEKLRSGGPCSGGYVFDPTV
ncbi:hypothetical protein J2X53_004499 [Pseudorhodobacter sp. 4114]|nr:hypothetical protein [Pseudorhodobacter sp. 4114]